MMITAAGVKGEPMDLIDRQAAIKIASGYCHPANIAKELAKLPSAQPEIIHCRECKYWMTDNRAENLYLCTKMSVCGTINTTAGFYCGMAVRRVK